MAIHLARLLPAASSDLPGQRRRIAPAARRRRVSLHGLAPDGVYPAQPVTGLAVRSYRTFSPLPAPVETRLAVCFLRHFPWGCPRRGLPGIPILWSPDFPLPPSQAMRAAAIRPSDSGRIIGAPTGRGQVWVGWAGSSQGGLQWSQGAMVPECESSHPSYLTFRTGGKRWKTNC